MRILLLFSMAVCFPNLAYPFKEISIREDRDGAGPSHILHLRENYVAIVDPLDAKIIAFEICLAPPCASPQQRREVISPTGVRFRQVIRQTDDLLLITEDETEELAIPRDISKWPSRFTTKPHVRLQTARSAKRNLGDKITLLPRDGLSPLPIRTVGPNYLASARELDRDARGNRYVLWKEVSFKDAPDNKPDSRTIQVNVHVGRFSAISGKLIGLSTIPRARMSRLGFDYVSILPNGSVILLADLDRQGFRIGECAPVKPSPITVAAFASPRKVERWATDPAPCTVNTFATPDADRIVPLAEEMRITAVDEVMTREEHSSRKKFAEMMNRFRDEKWSPAEANLRNPCQSVVVTAWGIDCPKPELFVRPAQFVREPYLTEMRGLPYDWGGFDSIDEFRQKLAQRYVTGNIGDTFWSNDDRRVTTGIDCSGLVSRVWGLSKHVATTKLAGVSYHRRQFADMRVGDILLLEKHHVVLYREQVEPDGASLALRVTEASSRCGSVCDSIYEIDFFHGYKLRSSFEQGPRSR